MNKRITMSITAAMMMGTLCAGDAFAEDAIRVGSLMALGTVTPYIAQANDAFAEAGLEVEVFDFADGSALMEAFAAGELDLAYVGVGPAATWYGKGLELQIVAGANGGGHVIMTRTESGIETIADLKDKMMAEPNVSTVTDLLLRAEVLKGADMNPDMDLILIPGMKPADMATALMATKEVDAMITWEPYASQAIATYGDEIHVLYDAAKELSEEDGVYYPGNALIASADFIAEHEELLDAYLAVHAETTDYINTSEDANAKIAEALQMEESIIEMARERTCYLSELDKEGILSILQWSVDLGYLSELPDDGLFRS